MTDIKVIERKRPEGSFLSRAEREARLQEIAKHSKLPQFHFDNFLELEDEWIKKEANRRKPDITALLVRKLIRYKGIIPIVPEQVSRLQNLDDVNEFFDIPTLRKFGQAEGGKVKKHLLKKPKEEVEVSEEKPPAEVVEDDEEVVVVQPIEKKKGMYMIGVQVSNKTTFVLLDDIKNYTTAVFTNNKIAQNSFSYQTSRNQSIAICGIMIDPTAPLVQYYKDRFPWIMNVFAAIMSGLYSAEYLHNKLFSPFHVTDGGLFEKNLKELMQQPLEMSGTYYYLFKNEENTKQVCTSLLEYLNYLERNQVSGYVNYVISNAFRYAENVERGAMPRFSELFKLIVTFLTKINDTSISPIEEKPVEAYAPGKDLLDFLKQIGPYMARGIRAKNSQLGLYYDFWAANLLVLLEKFFIADSSTRKEFMQEIQDFVTNQTKRGIEAAKGYKIDQRDFEIKFREMRKRWIYIQKFGKKRFDEVYEGHLLSIPLYDLIDKREADTVDVQYKKIEKFAEAYEKNSCPHLSIEGAMRMSDSTEIQLQKYEELKKFLPAKEREISKTLPIDFIPCNVCNFVAICPHVRDMMELEKRRSNDDEIRNFIFKYAGNTPLYLQYYCRICGEPISDTSEVEVFSETVEDQVSSVEDALRDEIWKESSFLVRNFVEFKGMQTNKYVNKFVSTLVDGIYQFVSAIEKKLLKAKTNTIDEIKDKKKLFTIIYLMALLAKAIDDNPTKLKFTQGKRQIQDVKNTSFAKIPTAKLLSQAVSIVLSSQSGNINRIEGMSDVVVRNSLLKAYKIISKYRQKSSIPQIKEHEMIVTLLLDPLYKYIVTANTLIQAEGYNGGKHPTAGFKKQKENLRDPRASLGKSIADMENSEYVFEGMKDLKFKLSGPPFEERIKSQNPSNLYKSYWIDSFNHTFDYLKSRVYINPLWDVQIVPVEGERPKLHIEINKEYQKFFERFSRLRAAERILMDLELFHNMNAIWKLPFKSQPQFKLPEDPNAYMARVYGYPFNSSFNFKSAGIDPAEIKKTPHFHEHKWDLITYRAGSVKKTLHKKDMKKKMEMEESDKTEWHVEDIVCSICFYPQSEIHKIVKDPIELMEEAQIIQSFYNYYISRCPKPTTAQIHQGDNLHQMDAKEVCKNCGFKKDYAAELQKSYFEKFISAYKKDIAEPDKEKISIDWGKDNIPSSIKNPSIMDQVKKWKFNQNVVTEMVNATYDLVGKDLKLKKTQYFNIWINLGLTAGLDFDNIQSGNESPYRNITTDPRVAHAREDRVSIYMRELIVFYSKLRNSKNIPNLETEIKELVENTKLVKALEKSPEFIRDYHQFQLQVRRQYYKDEDTYQRANWVLEFLCKTILKIYKSNKDTGPLFILFIGNVIETEKLMSKPKDNRIAAILATQKFRAEDDPSMVDNRAANTFDELVTDESNPGFEYDEMDYDGHNEEWDS